MRRFCIALVIAFLFSSFVCPAIAKTAKSKAKRQPTKQEWYQGGNLHNKKMIDWKKATSHNKVATCGDILVATYKKGNLKLVLSPRDLETIKKYSEILASTMDEAVKSSTNDREFLNCSVAETSVVAMAFLGWLKGK